MKSQQALQDTPGPGPGASVGTWESESESESFSVLCDSKQPHGLYSPWNSPGQNTGVCSLSLLQGIFPTQELDQGLLHCRRILYHLSHKGSPRILEWVAYPSPADLPDPGIEPGSPALQADSLPTELSGKTLGCREGGKKCLLGGGRRQGNSGSSCESSEPQVFWSLSWLLATLPTSLAHPSHCCWTLGTHKLPSWSLSVTWTWFNP